MKVLDGDWGLGIGDWGLGIGGWGQNPIPQTPNPNPHPQIFKIINNKNFCFFIIKYFFN